MSSGSVIGVFDSGIGGLSLVRELGLVLPGTSIEYVADSGHLPYGPRTVDFIAARALAITGFLAARGVQLVVVACNTATAAAASLLRGRFVLPVVGIEPAIKPAALATRNGIVGVLATAGTLESSRFAALLGRFAEGITVVARPCGELVARVEALDLDSAATRAAVDRCCEPLSRSGADVWVLGCTHFPFLRPLIEARAGPGVCVLDTGAAVAHRVKAVLGSRSTDRPCAVATLRAWTSGPPATVRRQIRSLLGLDAVVRPLPV